MVLCGAAGCVTGYLAGLIRLITETKTSGIEDLGNKSEVFGDGFLKLLCGRRSR
jgi:hypothetical protein